MSKYRFSEFRKKYWFEITISILGFFVLCTIGNCQLTSVTATVIDSDSQTWNNAQWKVQFVPNPAQPNQCIYNVNGVGLCTSTYQNYLAQSGTSNSSGALSVTLIDNTQINPAGSQWVWTIQSNTSAPATQYLPLTISGTTMNLSTYLSTNSIAPRIKIGNQAGIYAYLDIEITNQTQGNIYWNVSSQTSRQWTGTAWQNLTTSSWNGGTVFNPITAPGLTVNGPIVTQFLNNTCYADQQTGSTADVKIMACNTLLAAAGGGIIDGTGFAGTTQTIAATVTPSANVFLKLSSSTIFVPSTASVDGFSIVDNSGIDGLTWNSTSVSNYAGNAVKFVGNCTPPDRCYLHNFSLSNGTNSTNPATGTGILLSAASSVNAIAFPDIGPGEIIGFLNGMLFTSTGSIGSNNFVNDVKTHGVTVTNAVHCITLYSNPGDVQWNTFNQVTCEAGGGNIVNSTGLVIKGQTGSNDKANMFIGGTIGDYGVNVIQTSYSFDANSSVNWLQANMPFGSLDNSSDAGPVGSNQILNIAFPLQIQQMGIKNLLITPNTGYTQYWLATNGTGNQACVSSGGSPGSNPVCLDNLGNWNIPNGNIILGNAAGGANAIKLFPGTLGNTIFWIDNPIGSNLLRLSNGPTAGTNPVYFDNAGDFSTTGFIASTAFKIGSLTSNHLLASSDLSDGNSITINCGPAGFAGSTTSAPLSCAGVTSSSHCEATWIGTNITGGALATAVSTGSVTLTAATSNSGTASVACSKN